MSTADPGRDLPPPSETGPETSPDHPRQPAPPRTRASAAWIGVAVAALIAIALITFLAQNTNRVQISFLWMEGTTSLAIALLIAAVAGVLITLIIGTTRIVQLRHYAKKRLD